MNKPAYLVEGDLEQKFVQNTCPGSPVKKINCNGERTSLEAIAKRVETLGRLLHKRHSPLIVVFDREGREESSENLEKTFLEVLAQEKIDVPVIVGIPDKNLEAWILADYEMFLQSAKLGASTPISDFEGRNGKSVIKQLLGDGKSYVETIDGVAWLKAARPDVMQKYSPSFNRLFSALSNLDCWWLKSLELPLTANTDSSSPICT
jgi:Domain of unknown function (DUF4276)